MTNKRWAVGVEGRGEGVHTTEQVEKQLVFDTTIVGPALQKTILIKFLRFCEHTPTVRSIRLHTLIQNNLGFVLFRPVWLGRVESMSGRTL